MGMATPPHTQLETPQTRQESYVSSAVNPPATPVSMDLNPRKNLGVFFAVMWLCTSHSNPLNTSFLLSQWELLEVAIKSSEAIADVQIYWLVGGLEHEFIIIYT